MKPSTVDETGCQPAIPLFGLLFAIRKMLELLKKLPVLKRHYGKGDYEYAEYICDHLIVVVFFVGNDSECSIDLLHEKYAYKVVWKGHFR